MTKDEFFKLATPRTETINVPRLGDVIVRELTAEERDAYEAGIVVRRGKSVEANLQNLRAKLVALTVVDDAGVRVFADKDISAIGRLGSGVIDPLYAVAARLSGITQKDAEELAGNSEAGPA